MPNLMDELNRLREQDPDIATGLDFYGEIERIYQEALEAMGLTGYPQQEVSTSSNVSISFQNPSVSSYYLGEDRKP